MSSVAVEGIWMWECEMWQIRRGGKIAGPLELQSTVFLAWSLCWSSQATSGSSHTSWLREGNHLGFLSIQTSFWRLSKGGSGSGNLSANTSVSHKWWTQFGVEAGGTYLPLVVWGCLWQTVEKVSAAQHQTRSWLQTGSARHGWTHKKPSNQRLKSTAGWAKACLTFHFTSWPVMCVPMVRATTLHQRLDIPCLRFTATQQLFKLQKSRNVTIKCIDASTNTLNYFHKHVFLVLVVKDTAEQHLYSQQGGDVEWAH